MKSLAVAIVLLVGMNASGQAQSQKTTRQKAPQAVMDAFKKQYPNATIKSVSSEKVGERLSTKSKVWMEVRGAI